MCCLHRSIPSLLFLLIATPIAMGVVVADGDGSGNTSAPRNDPGFANIGTRGVGTAIYLGNRWVMTASHLGVGPVTFADQTYTPIPSETVRLGNPPGLSQQTDIRLLRISEDPGLPALRLPCQPIRLGSSFTMIGNGHDREAEPVYWDVQVNPGGADDVWTEVSDPAESDRQGFKTQESQSIRWGVGSVGLTELDTQTANDGDVMSFKASFSQSLGLENLAQAVRGDSGGAAFQQTGGLWELTGMIYAVDPLENQPGLTRSAVYGNGTFIADIYRYSDLLRQAADFEAARGDLNGDGMIQAGEIDVLIAMIPFSAVASCHFDVDRSGAVDQGDLDAMLLNLGTVAGDADLDGEVGFSDFLTLSSRFGTTASGWGNGDFDGNAGVDFADFLTLSGNFGQLGSLPPQPIGIATVPEPRITGWIKALFAMLVLRQKRRGRPAR